MALADLALADVALADVTLAEVAPLVSVWVCVGFQPAALLWDTF